MNLVSLNDISSLIKIPFGINEENTINYIKKHQEFKNNEILKQLNKYLNIFQEKWPNSSPQQKFIAFDLCKCNPEELLINLDSKDFLIKVNDILENKFNINNNQINEENSDSEVIDEEYNELYLKVDKNKKIDKRTRRPIIPLDPSIPKPSEISLDEWSKWSIAKRQSYINRNDNPNAYYYRNTPVGIKHITGPFTLEEKKLFIKRLNEFKDNNGIITGEWGIFSLGIPGRVGYQCSNFYRKLIEQGEINDPSYIKGIDGKFHHCTHFKDKSLLKIKSKKKNIISCDKIKSLILKFNDKEDFTLSMYDRWSLENPIPNWIDSITGNKMKVPTISPDLSLLDYNTWLQTLKILPEDPFTKKPLNKRQLIVLTNDNWFEFKEKILNKYGDDLIE